MIDALNNRMLFGALSNLRLAPHVREGHPGGSAAATKVSSAVGTPAVPHELVATAPLDGRNLPTSGEKLSLSPAALAVAQADRGTVSELSSYTVEGLHRAAVSRPEVSSSPLTSPDPTAEAAAMALAARAYGDDSSNGSAWATSRDLAAPAAASPARLSSLGVLRA